ncbi:PREDICTED: alpha-1,6-mannosyl-glycoprotein 2-beta-N-acetylglucosaminyltransferase-like [Priapulus caudatus]|uniref:Alpha-1,6-mannosyl-glycoprotein 2-beta-N-acetylglucosaminyltransferase n=1 Tax=Priapulus caudatus TaxID=37621 RepID=A0ABM1E8M7_PRICU|nr:PREDICTED: alpha-1,6-mannosyl-glycoprotein 2-beta-N-acetylglucosaminyltransferase-like [Priapulus caudatus]XP_014668549.1 PREDICTED: alpha-1,6-mannosyl-glycoprotein 2-beta-N-acetylglucosaminyltransferase-like [Priapulus caudatus]
MRQHMSRVSWRLLMTCLVVVGVVHLYLFVRLCQRTDSVEDDAASLRQLSRKPATRQQISELTAARSTSTTGRGRHGNDTVAAVNVTEWASMPRVMHTGDISEIQRVIMEINAKQLIVNAHLFDGFSWDGTIIVVQVHTRANYLHYLIESLRKTAGISDVLLIFSHDYYSSDVNDVIRKVDFCQVMQIYYPYSIQLNQHRFPGEDPSDCTRDIQKSQAKIKGCPNAEWQDSYGHYREANYTQIKHHWWWKLHFVMDVLEVGRMHKGVIVLLEEDHYVAPDFIHLLNLMITTQMRSHPAINILNLGNYQKRPNFPRYYNTYSIEMWRSSEHNMGMVLFRDTWKTLVNHTEAFCKYDDYNWDWTLMHISQNLMSPSLRVMYLRAPRIFHIGDCGMHKKGTKCDPVPTVSKYEGLLNGLTKFLFPDSIVLTNNPVRKLRKLKPNGGWGDPRDHQLCLNYSQSATV